MKVVLMEKDENIRGQLRDVLAFYRTLEIVEEFDNVNDANEYVCSNEVDCIFINANSGDARFSGDGSFLAYHLSENFPDLIIVFYSANELPLSDFLKMGCTEFFSLPIEGMEMQRVINRICYKYDLIRYKKESTTKSVMIKTKAGYQLIPVQEILFIEKVGRKNKLMTTDGKDIELSGYSLEELERVFSGCNFYRCYQSYIVNLSKVSYVRANSETKNYSLLFEGYAGEIMLSRDKYNEVVKLLKERYVGITL